MPGNTTRLDKQLLAISQYAFTDEQTCIQNILPQTEIFQHKSDAIFERAKRYVQTIREDNVISGVEGFIQQYGLDNQEGVTIMCLAEALLRIPDAKTADALIQDKLKVAEWEKHLSKSDSLFVNASTWGLMLTGSIIRLGDIKNNPAAILGKLIAKLGEPVIREALKKAMTILGNQFVLGNTIEEALMHAQPLTEKGYLFSYDMLGEGARSMAQADRFFDDYMHAIQMIGAANTKRSGLHNHPSVSIKLSALHPRYELYHHKRVLGELVSRIRELLLKAKENQISISIDAEEARRLDISLLVFQKLFADEALKDFEGIGFVLQAYQKRALPVLDYLIDLAETYHKRIPIRLVKGAYWDSEIKYAQLQGHKGYPVFTRKSHTDASYLACAAKILHNLDHFYPQFATHNALTVASILEVAGSWEFEFQRLYGMGENFYDQLVKKRPCRIYAPVGRYEALLPYLIRRLLENGANTSFVNLVVDESEPIGELLKNPVKKAIKNEGQPRPDIPLPVDLFGDERVNSCGFDLGNRAELETLRNNIGSFATTLWGTAPIVNGEVKKSASTKDQHIEQALDSADMSFKSWSQTPVDERATALERTADLLEDNSNELIAILMHEAKKTLEDAIAEVREAVDFCRYYAVTARQLFTEPVILAGPTGEHNQLTMKGKGIFICISPWNFPLAIFTGQVAAALVAGNSVIAKPATQTPQIAHYTVMLMHQAGIPTNVLHLLPGEGEAVGGRLIADERVAGVVFTGSTDTAKHINRVLAHKEGPIATLIAETGGQNAMVVDSTALPEQTVDDIITSAFGSAGQRCSALRVVYIQEDIADMLIELLAGAIKELEIGDPGKFSTDIGPVIDANARHILEAHIEDMHELGTFIAASPPAKCEGDFVVPHAFEIPSIHVLKREIFGPILHVIRYKSNDIEEVIKDINSTGYGLTFGFHSRIEEHYYSMHDNIQVGNCYVNRNMVGAVVGVQPFGGQGLSGTGPKAGGPHYLLRFVNERTLTINTAAIGGNLALLT